MTVYRLSGTGATLCVVQGFRSCSIADSHLVVSDYQTEHLMFSAEVVKTSYLG